MFIPDPSNGNPGATGVGQIDSRGNYTIHTAGVDGAILGSHIVVIEAREKVDLNVTSFAPSLIPEYYSDPSASGLSAEVKDIEENVIDFALTSQEPEASEPSETSEASETSDPPEPPEPSQDGMESGEE
jgi:hypothetical protein